MVRLKHVQDDQLKAIIFGTSGVNSTTSKPSQSDTIQLSVDFGMSSTKSAPAVLASAKVPSKYKKRRVEFTSTVWQWSFAIVFHFEWFHNAFLEHETMLRLDWWYQISVALIIRSCEVHRRRTVKEPSSFFVVRDHVFVPGLSMTRLPLPRLKQHG